MIAKREISLWSVLIFLLAIVFFLISRLSSIVESGGATYFLEPTTGQVWQAQTTAEFLPATSSYLPRWFSFVNTEKPDSAEKLGTLIPLNEKCDFRRLDASFQKLQRMCISLSAANSLEDKAPESFIKNLESLPLLTISFHGSNTYSANAVRHPVVALIRERVAQNYGPDQEIPHIGPGYLVGLVEFENSRSILGPIEVVVFRGWAARNFEAAIGLP